MNPLNNKFENNSYIRPWTSKEVAELIRDLRSELGDTSDNEAYDIADGILQDEPGLKKYITQVLGVRDALGWLADRIG